MQTSYGRPAVMGVPPGTSLGTVQQLYARLPRSESRRKPKYHFNVNDRHELIEALLDAAADLINSEDDKGCDPELEDDEIEIDADAEHTWQGATLDRVYAVPSYAATTLRLSLGPC